jgi:hypothetical protein
MIGMMTLLLLLLTEDAEVLSTEPQFSGLKMASWHLKCSVTRSLRCNDCSQCFS